jgi:hypothetical protein
MSGLSEDMGFSASYLGNLVRGTFQISPERCHTIAEFFGDNPNIILSLVGYYSPPEPAETKSEKRLVETIDLLPKNNIRTLLQIAECMRANNARLKAMGEALEDGIVTITVETDMGTREVDVPIGFLSLSDTEIYNAIRKAINER